MSQPWVKHLVCSKPQETANVLPSTWASANNKKLNPANVILQQELQQPATRNNVVAQTMLLEQKKAYSSFPIYKQGRIPGREHGAMPHPPLTLSFKKVG